MFVHFFPLHENHDGHLAGLMEAKPEELGKIYIHTKFSVGATVKAL